MSDKHKIKVKTEDEMIAQLKLLLNNGYSISVNRDINDLNLEEDDVSYSIVYCEQKKGE